jgi:predicted NUDIX family NTP pyrophosphohydrolase
MAKLSAGIVLWRGEGPAREVLLVHPGGPFWAKKDLGAWSIPKGEYAEGEDPLAVAKREFEEELGSPPPGGPYRALGEIVQPSRKLITAFAVEGNFDPATVRSNLFELEWPPKSGRMQSFPEVDRAAWFRLEEARSKIQPGQAPFIDRLPGLAASPSRTQ